MTERERRAASLRRRGFDTPMARLVTGVVLFIGPAACTMFMAGALTVKGSWWFYGSLCAVMFWVWLKTLGSAIRRRLLPEPVRVILYCPKCRLRHVDAPEPDVGWTNPPHKSHRCKGCGTIWRAADVHTEGVETINTHGKVDTVRFDDGGPD